MQKSVLLVTVSAVASAYDIVNDPSLKSILEDPRNADGFLTTNRNHRSRRSNTGFFEEAAWNTPNFEQECIEEQCRQEELREIYPDDNTKLIKTWADLTTKCTPKTNDKNEWDRDAAGCSSQGTQLCIQYWNRRDCLCENGWNGDLCDEDIDECNSETPVCGANASCSNFDGGFVCECPVGFEEVLNEDGSVFDCREIGLCDNLGNEEGQTCVEVEGLVQCSCDVGFGSVEIDGCSSNESGCKDIDECEEEWNCDRETHFCVNTVGSFYCQAQKAIEVTICDAGTYLNDQDICVDIDECEESVCSFDQNCVNTHGSFTCVDKPKNSSGQCSAEVDPCTQNNGFGGCHHVCSSVWAGVEGFCSYSCSCEVGFELSCDGKSCVRV